MPQLFKKISLCLCAWTLVQAALFAQSNEDLATMIALLDREKLSTIEEAKSLREKNQSKTQQAPVFDYSYAIVLMKFGRWQDAIDVLQPFVLKRPQVYRARMLLVRAYIELEKYEAAEIECESMLESLPSDSVILDELAKKLGIFSTYLRMCRADATLEDLGDKLHAVAETKLPDSAKPKYEDGVRLVTTTVEKLNADIERLTEKAEEETEAKIEGNLQDAERLKSEAESKQADLQSRDKDRVQKLEQVRSDLAKLEVASTNLLARQNLVENQILNATRLQQNLVQTVTQSDANGNTITTQQIVNQPEYNRLGRMIASYSAELLTNQAQGRNLLGNYRQLQAQAATLTDQKEYDAMFTKSKMSELNKAAENKQNAERDADRKSKLSSSAAKKVFSC
ncbi:MAG: hypothetical protein U0930_14465 [Pirellulales bacterium]